MQDEAEVLGQGLGDLRKILGHGWEVGPVNRAVVQGQRVPQPGPAGEQLISIQGANSSYNQVLVEARLRLTPLQARNEFRAKVALMHDLTGNSAVLVIAPWLSPRTRQALEELGYGYLDLTGNISLRLQGIVIRTQGAQQDPWRTARRPSQLLRGHRAGQFVRVLADAMPPYRATELASASGVSLSYISRLLDALEEETLVTREGRVIVDVDWQDLLRLRASQYDLLKVNPSVSLIAPQGPEAAIDLLLLHWDQVQEIGNVAVTGTFAAREIAPATAVGGQLMLYVPPDTRQVNALDRIAAILGLLRADTGADVVLLRATNSIVFDRRRLVNGIPHVALSQLVIDCLGGTGRMPAEGEAVLAYMAQRESQWRARSLSELNDSLAG